MARLPTIGGDRGNWGALLNEFLGVGHNADGTLRGVYNNRIVVSSPFATAAQNVSAIREAITEASISATGAGDLSATVELGAGDWLLDDTIEVRSKWGLRIVGQGMGTRLMWEGASDKPMFRFAHSRQCGLENMMLNFDADAYAAVQLRRDNAQGSVGIPTYCRFVNLVINGNNQISHGFVIGGAGNVDANNDFHYFEQCEVNGYGVAGWLMRGDTGSSQAYNIMMTNCRAYAGTGGLYAVEAGGTFPASFAWHGGFVNGNQVADFNLGRSYSPHLIEFVNSENSKRFILMNSSHYSQAIVRGCRWAGNAIHEDMQAIIVDGSTKQLALEGNSIGDGGAISQPVQLAFLNNAIVSMRLNRVYSGAETVFSGGIPGELFGNLKITNESTLATVELGA